MAQLEAVKKELIETDETFRNLARQHQQHEQRLDELNHLSLRSESDEIEERQLKVQKLHLKDQMEAMLRAHAQPAVREQVPA